MDTTLIDYCLRFNKYDVFENVSFGSRLTKSEIDSLTFLFSVYFDQKQYVPVRGLTFFTEFNQCVETIKNNFESKQNTSEIKRIFSLFLRDEFMKQVPNFQIIMKYLGKYYRPVLTPNINELSALCSSCGDNRLLCFECRCRYLSASVSAFDVGIQDGWDIFLRPMFGLPLFLNILLRTEFDENNVFNADDLITNSFAQFLYNLLCDKSTSNFVNHKMCQPFVNECRRVTVGLVDNELEMLLCSLNMSSYHIKLFAPFKRFMDEIGHQTKLKKINKVASVVFTGFYMRHYLDAAPNKTLSASELEIRNVCRMLFKGYNNNEFEQFIEKLKTIKLDLCVALMENLLVPEHYIRNLCVKYDLDKEISVLINQNSTSLSLQ
uniref:p48 protein n=1 Tax=Helicoverpa armigera nucleopolyhedrovirus TaxID=51313 RepID=A0A0E3JAL5_9ABAC|nr:p48 protein [Helicoverpa armigera nucleopolyhedrovirus]AJP07513.1 p48 protein [Helicoverpa armigera nucleopolyhedrovirus]